MKYIAISIIVVVFGIWLSKPVSSQDGPIVPKSCTNGLECLTEFFRLNGSNQLCWSNHTYGDAVMIVKPTQESYHLGREMLVSITITNISDKEISLYNSRNAEYLDYLFLVSYTNGNSIVPPDVSEGDVLHEVFTGIFGTPYSHAAITIPPQQSWTIAIDFSRLVRIEKEGTYYLKTFRRTSYTTNLSLIADQIKINVKK